MNRLFRFFVTIIGFITLTSVSMAGKTVLEYPESIESNQSWSLPEFTAGQWQLASTAADEIVTEWQNQALTVPWTKLTLAKFIKHKIAPTRGARALALVHVAMHDALHHPDAKLHDARISVSVAASKVLSYLFPAEEHAFMRIAQQVIETITGSQSFDSKTLSAISLGQMIGQQVVEYAEKDGAQRGWNGKRLQWYGEGRYYGPGSWEPTGPYFYYPPDEPFAPGWKPWVLQSPDQFRPEPPPVYGTEKFLEALNEVIETGKNLTDEEKHQAKFWVDGHGSVTPAGHWNQIAIELLNDQSLNDRPKSDKEVAQLFMQLNIAMADTFIAAWDSKYHYWFIRPVTAAKKLLGIKFKPYILTPPFPSYVSGHAATSGAAAAILAVLFPERSDELIAIGEAAAMSRLYGGIHFRFDNDNGLELGRNIANHVLKNINQQDNQEPTRKHQ